MYCRSSSFEEQDLSCYQKVHELYLCCASQPDGPSRAWQATGRQQRSPSVSREDFAGTHESSGMLGVLGEFS